MDIRNTPSIRARVKLFVNHAFPACVFLFSQTMFAQTTPALKPVAAGTFVMGANAGSGPCYSADELPNRLVTLSRGFLIGESEVGVADFCDFLNRRPAWIQIAAATNDGTSNSCYGVIRHAGSDMPLFWLMQAGQVITNNEGSWEPVDPARGAHPVVNVTWYGAALFCNYLSEIEGYEPMYDTSSWTCNWSLAGQTNGGYHLPSEAQWEYAARGWQRNEAFPWGRFMLYELCNIYKSRASFDYDEPTNMPCTTPPASYPPNGFGLHDVIGNAGEWCNDWYNERYYASAALIDPVDAAPGADYIGSHKVVRGGGWAYSPMKIPTVSARGYWHPSTGSKDIGFRVLREWSGETNSAPTSPLNLAALTNLLGNLYLAWQKPLSDNHDGYFIEVGGVYAASFSADAAGWSVPAVQAGEVHAFDLYATNRHGASAPLHFEVTAFAAEPPMPGNLHQLANYPTNLTLGWEAPQFDNQHGYYLTRDESLCAILPADATSWTDSNVVADVSYMYRLYATNNFGASDAAALFVTISNQLCVLDVTPAEYDLGGGILECAISVSNSGLGILHWTAAAECIDGAGWMQLSPTSGSGNASITLSIDRSELPQGSYDGRVVIFSNGGDQTVDIHIRAGPALSVSPITLDFGYFDESLELNISNPGIAGVFWTNVATTMDGAPWLSSTPTTGADDGTVTVTVDRSVLSEGVYTGQVLFTSSHDSATIAVAMNVAPVHWWVDSAAAPGGDGRSPGTAFNDIQPAIDAAPEDIGAMIHIRGGEGRVYTNTVFANKRYQRLVAWDASPLLSNGFDFAGAFLTITGERTTLSNLTFKVNVAALDTGDSVIELIGSSQNSIIEACDISMADGPGGAWNQGAGIELSSPTLTNVIIRNCCFHDYGQSGNRFSFIGATPGVSHCHIVGNTFSNTESCITGGGFYYTEIASNRFINTYPTFSENWGIIRAHYNGMQHCDVHHNIVWNNNGISPSFVHHLDFGGMRFGRIYNNTTYGIRHFAVNNDGQPDSWDNVHIFNNLIVGCTSNNIDGRVGGFDSNSRLGYNLAWNGPEEIIAYPGAIVLVGTNYHVDPVLFNVDDLSAPGFLTPDAASCAEIVQGYGTVDSFYPTYIGALMPLTPPEVVITLPHAGADFVQHENIRFEGHAKDSEDAAIHIIEWASDIDGTFGVGASCEASGLSVGSHTITLTGADTQGISAADQIALVILADSDIDGLPDDWQSAYWPDGGSGGAANDYDGDGLSNYAEWLAGSDPTSDSSLFELHGYRRIADESVLTWSGIAGRHYDILWTTNLLTGSFQTLTGFAPHVEGHLSFTGRVDEAGSRMFYRIRVGR